MVLMFVLMHFCLFVCLFFAARTWCLSNVADLIQKNYQKREGVIVPIPWCYKCRLRLENIFTRLTIVAKGITRGTATRKEVTSMTSIFTPHEHCEQPRIVLIEGKPGTGKTTFCQKLAYDWATTQGRRWDESFPRIDVLLLLRCSKIKSTIWDAIAEQILPDEIKPVKEMFFQVLKENPSKVLLVLDGLDEADPQKLEMFLKLIQRKELPGCYIVLTSHHKAGSKVRPYIDTLLEIVGFTTTEAECYIRKYFKDKKNLAEQLISEVKFHKDLRELTQNPLNTLLLCFIFDDSQEILPTNRTQLYVEIVLYMLTGYEIKNGLSNRDEDLLLVYKKELMILGEAALDCLRKQELYFDDHKGNIKESLLIKFGFLSIQAGGSMRAPCDRYGFYHKSFQEFFAGYFLAFSIDDATNARSVLTDERYMGELSHVFEFMRGILTLLSEETGISVVQGIVSIVNETGRTSHKFVSHLMVIRYLIKQCKTCSGDLPTKLDRTFGESLELVEVVERSSFRPFTNEVIWTFFKILTLNFTVTNLKLFKGNLSTEVTNLLPEALRGSTIPLVLRRQIHLLRPSE